MALLARRQMREAKQWGRVDAVLRGLEERCAAPRARLRQVADAVAIEMHAGLARPRPIDKATCDWMCRLSNNSTDDGLQVRIDDYDCCNMGCHCSFYVSIYTLGSAGHGMRAAAAAAVWPIDGGAGEWFFFFSGCHGPSQGHQWILLQDVGVGDLHDM